MVIAANLEEADGRAVEEGGMRGKRWLDGRCSGERTNGIAYSAVERGNRFYGGHKIHLHCSASLALSFLPSPH